MVGTPKDDQRFIPARTGSPFVGSRCSGVPLSGDTLRQRSPHGCGASYITSLYFRVHFSMVRCGVRVQARRGLSRVLVAAKSICRVVKSTGWCLHCIRAGVDFPMQAAQPPTMSDMDPGVELSPRRALQPVRVDELPADEQDMTLCVLQSESSGRKK